MAKGKHSVALFEVISAGKTSSRSSILSTPKWWFKKIKPDAPVAPQPNSDPANDSGAPAPRASGVDLKLDPDYQRIKFNVSYNSAVVAGFTVVVVVGLAYIIGTRMSRGPAPAVAGTTAQIRSGPVNRGVLDLSQISRPTTPSAAAPVEHEQPSQTSTPPTPQPAALPAAPQDEPQRTIGLNYVVVQSYPTEQMANEARDLLAQNGIGATVEKELKQWGNAASSKYSVVGLRGFNRVRYDPDFAAYVKSIEDVNAKMTKNPKYNKFQPAAYLWRAQTAK